jgi:hypothetical protein
VVSLLLQLCYLAEQARQSLSVPPNACQPIKALESYWVKEKQFRRIDATHDVRPPATLGQLQRSILTTTEHTSHLNISRGEHLLILAESKFF